MMAWLAAVVWTASTICVNGCGSEFIDFSNKRLGSSRNLAAESSWMYEGDGPSHWSTLFPECGKSEQSPINIPSAYIRVTKILSDSALPALNLNYSLETGSLMNNNHTVQVNLAGQLIGSNSLTKKIGRAKAAQSYTLAQFHFHWSNSSNAGSEHRIDGDAFPMEAHFVHFNSKYRSLADAVEEDDGLLVIGVLFQLSTAENSGIANLTLALKGLGAESVPVEVNPSGFFEGIDLTKYYLYGGSLTTPKCFQSVTWVVMEERVPITLEQLQAFRDVPYIESHNFRPVQPLNERTVFNREFKVSEIDIHSINSPSDLPTRQPTSLSGYVEEDEDDEESIFKITSGIFAGTTVILAIGLTGVVVSRRKTHPSPIRKIENSHV